MTKIKKSDLRKRKCRRCGNTIFYFTIKSRDKQKVAHAAFCLLKGGAKK